MPQNLGLQGELLAKKLLTNKGYRFLTQNFRTHIGEIDLIFRDHQTIVFVEVKARTHTLHGLPQEAVTPTKLRTIRSVAQLYLLQKKLHHLPARIDVVAVNFAPTTPRLTHLQNVSY